MPGEWADNFLNTEITYACENSFYEACNLIIKVVFQLLTLYLMMAMVKYY
jgi:hypothetical protein